MTYTRFSRKDSQKSLFLIIQLLFYNNDILNCKNDDLYKLFLNLYSLHKYEIRFLNNKNAYIKFSINDYFVKIKKDKIVVADNLKKIEQIIEEETQNAIQLIKKRIHTD